MDKWSDKCWNHSNVIIILKFVLLLNEVNISTGGNSTLDSSWAVWLLNSPWPCSPVSFGRHMHCQVPLGKEMSFQLVIQHLWLPAMPQVASAVLLGQGREASPQSQFWICLYPCINKSSPGSPSLVTGWNPGMMRKGKATPQAAAWSHQSLPMVGLSRWPQELLPWAADVILVLVASPCKCCCSEQPGDMLHSMAFGREK